MARFDEVKQNISIGIGHPDNGAEHLAEEHNKKQEPSLAEIATDTISVIRYPHRVSWHKIKTLLNKVQLRLSPPDLDFRGSSDKANAVQEMKEAVEKSFGSSKSTVEGSARSAAKAVQKTAEKVKESMPDEEVPRSEL
ncbi:hypothetical protein CRG98_046171 [Punica granatum]|uniref:Uncharacterized protein n=1 Tax=Punica granatum TaxID=22663 RepID=A0A2I0HPN7_PUNGR|nr:hypothetical protein CRG98_046171 [Punica granatum]